MDGGIPAGRDERHFAGDRGEDEALLQIASAPRQERDDAHESEECAGHEDPDGKVPMGGARDAKDVDGPSRDRQQTDSRRHECPEDRSPSPSQETVEAQGGSGDDQSRQDTYCAGA